MAFALSASATSLVVRLADKAGTLVYYKIAAKQVPLMDLREGTIKIGARNMALTEVAGFSVSATDYQEAAGKIDGDAEVPTEVNVLMTDDALIMKGKVRIYDAGGRLVKVQEGSANLEALPSGLYVITNGVSTIKICKP